MMSQVGAVAPQELDVALGETNALFGVPAIADSQSRLVAWIQSLEIDPVAVARSGFYTNGAASINGLHAHPAEASPYHQLELQALNEKDGTQEVSQVADEKGANDRSDTTDWDQITLTDIFISSTVDEEEPLGLSSPWHFLPVIAAAPAITNSLMAACSGVALFAMETLETFTVCLGFPDAADSE